ncbi:hypothetical protein [Desulfobacterium sp. N47]|uniref:Uncharacterized protein n=1 Tax=uncultured Desulfobacterium sp. TaxID=201089 RepID=E1YA98_9BACT|nr:unknown protein [uncultured Desulfobacterium sp.]
MKYIHKSLFSAFLLLSIVLFTVSDGQCRDGYGLGVYPQVAGSPTMLLIGTFYPADKRPKVDFITIKIREKKFYFKIDIARNLTGTEHAYTVLNQLLPPELKLIGSDKMIDSLLKKNIIGKLYSLKGTIYIFPITSFIFPW